MRCVSRLLLLVVLIMLFPGCWRGCSPGGFARKEAPREDGCQVLLVEVSGLGGNAMVGPEGLKALVAVHEEAAKIPGVIRVVSVVDLVERLHAVVMEGTGKPGELPSTIEATLQLLLLLEMGGTVGGFPVLATLLNLERSQATVYVQFASVEEAQASGLAGALTSADQVKLPAGFHLVVTHPDDCATATAVPVEVNAMVKAIAFNDGSLEIAR